MGTGSSKSKKHKAAQNLPYCPIFYNCNPPLSVVHPFSLPSRMNKGVVSYPEHGYGAVVIPLNSQTIIPKTEESASDESEDEAEVWDGKAEFNYKKQNETKERATARTKRRQANEKTQQEAYKATQKLPRQGGPSSSRDDEKLSSCFFIYFEVDEEGRPLAFKHTNRVSNGDNCVEASTMMAIGKGFNFSPVAPDDTPRRNVVGQIMTPTTAKPKGPTFSNTEPEGDVSSGADEGKSASSGAAERVTPSEGKVGSVAEPSRVTAQSTNHEGPVPSQPLLLPRGGSLLLKPRPSFTGKRSLAGRHRAVRITKVKAPKLFQVSLFNDSLTHESHITVVLCYTAGRIFLQNTEKSSSPLKPLNAAAPTNPLATDQAATSSADPSENLLAPNQVTESSSGPPSSAAGICSFGKEEQHKMFMKKNLLSDGTSITRDSSSITVEHTRRKVRPLPFIRVADDPPTLEQLEHSIIDSQQQLDGDLCDVQRSDCIIVQLYIVLPPTSGVVVGRADFRAYTVSTKTVPFQGKASLTVMGRYSGPHKVRQAQESINEMINHRTYRHFLANIMTEGERKKIHGMTSIDLFNKINF